MYPMKKRILILQAAFAFVLASPISATEYSVPAGVINVRSGPGTKHSRVFQLNTGDRVTEIARQDKTVQIGKWKGRWVQIVFKGKKGWVLDAFLKPIVADQDAAPPNSRPVPINKSGLIGTYWEVKPNLYDVKARNHKDDGIGEQPVTVITKEQMTVGTGEGSNYCKLEKVLRLNMTFYLFCKVRGTRPDFKNSGETPGGKVVLKLIAPGRIQLLSEPW